MRLLNFSKRDVLQSEMRTDRLLLTQPVADDYNQWKNLREISRDHLQPFEPQWTQNELTRASFKSRLRQVEADHASERGLHWLLKLTSEQQDIVGGISLTNIRRGVAQNGTLGYWVGAPYVGNGYMGETLTAVCNFAFRTLKLHRLEAATVFENYRSQRLLVSCNFRKEGSARAYLKINGNWKDHVLFARLSTDAADEPQ